MVQYALFNTDKNEDISKRTPIEIVNSMKEATDYCNEYLPKYGTISVYKCHNTGLSLTNFEHVITEDYSGI